MVPVPEMEAFATRFGFRFRAHAIGHANRSAHVERKFRHIEQNFLAGREFQDWDDLNRQAREWCDQVNAKAKRDLHARPIDLFVQEKITLNPLPAYVPEVYRLHHRVVDVEGYVRIQRNAYSVPYKLIGRQLEVRESHHRIDVYDGPRQVASHARSWDGVDQRVTVKEHRPPRGEGRSKAGPFPEERDTSPSGLDWHWVCSRLEAGQDPDQVRRDLAATAQSRRGQDADRYAKRTVESAMRKVGRAIK
jgi:hypothetical protein